MGISGSHYTGYAPSFLCRLADTRGRVLFGPPPLSLLVVGLQALRLARDLDRSASLAAGVSCACWGREEL
jgi:hypothetical protein